MTDSMKGWATALSVFAVLGIAVIVLAVLFGVAFGDMPRDIAATAGLAPGADPGRARTAAVALAGALPALGTIYVLWQTRGLLALYADGQVLTSANATATRRIGVGLLCVAALDVLSGPLVSVIASAANPPGQRVLAVGIEGADMGLVLAGGVMLMIGWAMAEAARAADENRSFV